MTTTIRHFLPLSVILIALPLVGCGHAGAGPSLGDSASASGDPSGSPSASVNACAGQSRCYDAGPFSVTVSNVVTSWGHLHRSRVVRLNLRVHNPGSEPLVVAIPWHSSAFSLVDNAGDGYAINWLFPSNVVGFGGVNHGKIDPRFVVPPHGSRDASLIFGGGTGTGKLRLQYRANFPLDLVHVDKAKGEASVGGQYNISFDALGDIIPCGNPAASASTGGSPE